MKTLFISFAATVLVFLLAGCGSASSTPVSQPGPHTSVEFVMSGLPSGTVQAEYGGTSGFQLSATGGVAPYFWSWVPDQGSTLPPGLALSTTGLISGVPTTTGKFNVNLTVSDSESPAAHASGNYSITIAVGQPVSPGAPPNGTVGQTYGGIISINKNRCAATFTGWSPDLGASWSWSAAPGSSLPPGLGIGVESYTCGGSTRCCVTVTSPPLLHGVPTAVGTYDVIVTIGASSTNYRITISGPLSATAAARLAADPQGYVHYKLIDLGSAFGGPQSYVNIPQNYAPVLNNRGGLVGWAETANVDPYPNFCVDPDCLVTHAFEWQNGTLVDLSALPGGGSSQAYWISPNGLVAGVSQNGEIDPLSGFPQNRAVLWMNGQITNLGTLPEGGYQSLASAVNSRGQVTGVATNTIPDDFSQFGTTQTRAFIWQRGVMQDLGTLGGTDAVANLINEQGQVVGESYTSQTPSAYCAQIGFPLATDAFLWEHGTMKDLGSFGGTCTFASDLNSQGQVVGLSSLPGDESQHAFLWDHGVLEDLPNMLEGNNGFADALNNNGDVVGWASLPGDQTFHAALWKDHTMTDLGTVGGDVCSIGTALNESRQVVGLSVPDCDFSQARAFLWTGRSVVDLNTLIPSGSPLYLTFPETINDEGEIAGVGLDFSGNQHAFLLIPCDRNHPDVQGCDYGMVNANDLTAISVRAPVAQKPAPVTRIVPGFYGMTHLILRELRKGPLPENGSIPTQSTN